MIKKIILASITAALMATSSLAAEVLTQEQKDTLLFIYQEEKVARDAYITLGNYYANQTVYANIQKSEQEHMDSAQLLCEKYGVDISNVYEEDIGVFIVPVLQELYDTLIAQGYQSELSGLMVGEYIELTDIDDLEHAEIGMPSDVVKVFENLKAGSYNHLDAFREAIDAYNK
jgi:hypothetical protein